jgi:predicted transcriptional regulator of viral defense system
MRKTSLLLKKLHMDEKDFVTSAELKRYCKSMGLSYETSIKYFVYRGYLTRIFKGIFYIKSLEEVKMGKSKYSHLELVAKGLELKGVENWYFGLYTALKLNNMTHEHFAVEYVVNDKLFRPKPMNIAGYKYKFIKLAPRLLKFGITENKLRYSDAEKTILDFIYTWRYNGVPKEKIILDVSEWIKNLSGEKIRKYAINYPKTVQAIVDMVVG